jgi:hypothetical protein
MEADSSGCSDTPSSTVTTVSIGVHDKLQDRETYTFVSSLSSHYEYIEEVEESERQKTERIKDGIK